METEAVKKLALLLCVFLFSTSSFANGATHWQMLTTTEKNAVKPVKKAQAPMPRMSKMSKLGPISRTYSPRVRPVTVTMFPGSMRANITRIAKQHGWRTLVWNSVNDYSWVGKTTITAPRLTGVFTKILADYPLQANFFDGNHVLAITPRTLL